MSKFRKLDLNTSISIILSFINQKLYFKHIIYKVKLIENRRNYFIIRIIVGDKDIEELKNIK